MKKCSLIFLFSAVIISWNPCYAQLKKDTLFGFVGTWKNKTTFIIDSNLYTGAKGGTIIITPKKQITISTPGNDGYNKKIEEDIKGVDKAIDEIPNEIFKEEGVSQATLALLIKEQLVKLKDDIKSLKLENVEMGAGQKSAQASPNSCLAMETKYNELVAFYEAHKNEDGKKYKFNLPPLPEADYFDCWFCEKQKQTDYDKQVADYVQKFAKKERDYCGDAFAIMKELAIDISTGNLNPKKPITCSIDNNKLTFIFYWLPERMGGMTKQLLKDNRKNYKVLIPLANTYVFIDNLVRKSNGSEVDDYVFTVAASLWAKLRDTLLTQLKKEKDYTLLSAVPFMVGLDRAEKIMNGNGGDMTFIGKLNDVGHFNLTVEMDAKIGKDGGYIIVHLKGISKMTFELDSTDCLHIIPDWKENFKSDPAKWNSVSMKVIALEMLTPKGVPPKYIGTTKYRSPLPMLNLNFCKQGADSVYFEAFSPDPPDNGIWLYTIPKAPPQRVPEGLMGVDRIFQSVDDMKKEALKIKAPPSVNGAAMNEIQKLSDDIEKNGPTPEKMKRMQELTEKMLQPIQEVTLPMSNFKFRVNLQNKNAVLFDHSFDAKQIKNPPEMISSIIYGYFKIKLEAAH